MFHTISEPVLARMHALEQIDARDRLDGTPRLQRMRQVPPVTGHFLAIMAASAPEGDYIEIGTSAGYSTMWISLACEMLGRTLTTYELLPAKAALARQTFQMTGVEKLVRFVEGDARQHLTEHERIAFCFLDAEKEIYAECYEAVVPRLVKGGLLLADNAIDFKEVLGPMLDRALADERLDALIVPIGKGVLLCRKI
jgi:caffeoyl-CoA O-methyltransferase